MITRYIKIAIFVFLILIPSYSFAGEYVDENFDNLNTGEIVGQTNWSGNTGKFIVSTSTSKSSPNSLKIGNLTNNYIGYTSTSTPTTAWIGYWVYVPDNVAEDSYINVSLTNSINSVTANIGISKNNGDTGLYYINSGELIEELNTNEWHYIAIKQECISDYVEYSYSIDGKIYIDAEPPDSRACTTFGKVQLYGYGNTNTYIDDIVVSTEAIDLPPANLDYTTRIISISPANNEVIATTTVNGQEGATTTIAVQWYINSEDISFIQGLEIQIQNIDQNYIYGTRLLSPYSVVSNIDPEIGAGSYSYEIWLPFGGYKVSADINTNYLGGLINNPFAEQGNGLVASQDDSNPLHQYHIYTVGGNTLISGLQQDINNQLEGILGATSTGATIQDCNVLSGFNAGGCFAFMFIPSGEQISGFYNVVSNNIFSKFPLGYVWSVVTIFSDDTTEAIPIIQGTIKGTGVADGVSFSLPLEAGMFDWFYNATSSRYGNSTSTFFETTYEYWKVFVYLMLAVYMLQRILGTGVIGIINNDAIQTKRDFKRFIGRT